MPLALALCEILRLVRDEKEIQGSSDHSFLDSIHRSMDEVFHPVTIGPSSYGAGGERVLESHPCSKPRRGFRSARGNERRAWFFFLSRLLFAGHRDHRLLLFQNEG